MSKRFILIPFFITIVIVLALILIISLSDSTTPTEEIEKVEIADYETASTIIDYRKAMLGDYEKGKLFNLNGIILQIVNDKYARIEIGNDSFYVQFREEPRILEKDEISIKTRYAGTKKYKSVRGDVIEIPYLYVDFYEVIKER